MKARRHFSVIGVLLLVVAPGRGRAVAGSERADPPLDENQRSTRARELNNKGLAEYDLGHYSEAIRDLDEAYRLYPDPRILFNLGQSYRKNHENARAIERFRAYVRSRGPGPDRNGVEDLIHELEVQEANQKALDRRAPQEGASLESPPLAPAVARIEESRPWYSNTLGWCLVGGGAAAIGTGIGFFASASSLEDQLATAPEPEVPGLRSDIHTRRSIGTAALIVGGLAFAGGVTVFIVSPRTVTREIVPIEGLRLSMGPQTISLSGRF